MFEALESVKVTWVRVFDMIEKIHFYMKIHWTPSKIEPPVTLTLSKALNMEQAVFLQFFPR